MGWFSDAVDAVSDGVSAVADAVEDVVEEVGEAVGTGVEAVGDAIDDGLSWLGEHTGAVGGAVFGWLGGVISGAFHLVGSLIKGAFGIIGGVIGGLIRVLGGILTLNGSMILEGLGDIFSSVFGGIVVILGKAVAFVQVIIAVGRDRPLTDEEKRQLRRAFRDSLNYYVVRVVEGHAGLFQIGANRFVLGNTIYFKKSEVKIEYLVHESVHVWQYQNGGARYTTDNIYAQVTEDGFNEPDVYVREIDAGKTEWDEFHPEAQAELIEGVWMEGDLHNGTVQSGSGCFYDANNTSTFGRFLHEKVDYTEIANNAVARLRDGRTPDWGVW